MVGTARQYQGAGDVELLRSFLVSMRAALELYRSAGFEPAHRLGAYARGWGKGRAGV